MLLRSVRRFANFASVLLFARASSFVDVKSFFIMLVAYERLILNWSCRDSKNYPESESTQFTLRQGTSAYCRIAAFPGTGNLAPGFDINPVLIMAVTAANI